MKKYTQTSLVIKFILPALLFTNSSLFAQSVGINYSGTAAHQSALLDIDISTGANKGLLIPRMTLAQRNSISNPATSLLIYQTDNTPGYYYNSGTPASPVWTILSTGGGAPSQWTTSGSNIYYNTGSVGINTGTVAPTARIQVISTGSTSATHVAKFQSAGGLNNVLTIRDDGRVGINSNGSSQALDMNSIGVNNTYESVLKVGVTDAPNDYFFISNGSNINGEFIPMIGSTLASSSASPPLYFYGTTPLSNDVGTVPMIRYDARTYSPNGQIATRPIAQFTNYSTRRVTIMPNGSFYIGATGGAAIPTAQLHVVGSGTTSATYTAKFFNSTGTNNSLVIRDDGKVGIGVAAPTHLLELSADDAVKPNGGSWSVPSDIRLKKDTVSYKDGLALIKKIKPINYKYNGLAGTPKDNKTCIGISAQEMQAIAPHTVTVHKKELWGDEATNFPYSKTFLRNEIIHDPNDTIRDGKMDKIVPVYQADVLVFDPSSLVYTLINAIKELDNAYAILKKDSDSLKAKLSEVESKIKPK